MVTKACEHESISCLSSHIETICKQQNLLEMVLSSIAKNIYTIHLAQLLTQHLIIERVLSYSQI